MEIQHEDNGKKGAFFISDANSRLAEMTYTWAGDTKLIIDHTDVSEALKGQSVGLKLLRKVAEMARQKQVKIMPLCPFAKRMMLKMREEFDDVLL